MRRVDFLIIGGGATGAGIARDLALRGAEVVLLERSDFAAGASGRNHGMLHSGGRYAVKDPVSAAECAIENTILRRIAAPFIEPTGGLFVSVEGDDDDYPDKFRAGCSRAGIRCDKLTTAEARALEPGMTDRLSTAFEVDDGSVDPFLLTYANVLSAREAGATALNHAEVTRMEVSNGRITSVDYQNARNGVIETLRPELVINAAGAWADRIAAIAGANVAMSIDKGTMAVLNGRHVFRLVNHLRSPSDGDIVVPSHSATLIGTTSSAWPGTDVVATREEVDLLIREASLIVPSVRKARAIRAYAGVRPLPAGEGTGREASRSFKIIDHSYEGVDNLITVVGGKLTTYRMMAEKVADLSMRALGRGGECVTSKEPLFAEGERVLSGIDQLSASRLKRYGGASGPIAEACLDVQGGTVACSCESTLGGELAYFSTSDDVISLSDLMRRTRAGMGYCQGGQCVFRMLSSMIGKGDPQVLLDAFLRERWKGIEPVLFGDQLRAEALKSALFRTYGIDHTSGGEP